MQVGRSSYAASGRALAANDGLGAVQILADANTDSVLGVQIVGPHASEVLQAVVVAMEFGATSADIESICCSHPSLGEAVIEAAADVHGLALHAPISAKR